MDQHGIGTGAARLRGVIEEIALGQGAAEGYSPDGFDTGTINADGTLSLDFFRDKRTSRPFRLPKNKFSLNKNLTPALAGSSGKIHAGDRVLVARLHAGANYAIICVLVRANDTTLQP